MKRLLLLAVCVAAVSLGACSVDSKLPVASGEANVRAINAIPTSSGFSFLIEERLITNVEYKTSSSTSRYDDLEYTFNFEVAFAGATQRTRVASQFVDVVADRDYTFVITGTIAAPDILLWEADIPEYDANDTAFDVRFAHTASALGDVDIYFAAAGVVPVLGEQVATLSFGDIAPNVVLEAGEFVMFVTAAGDPATVLFESSPFSTGQQTSLIISVFDSDPNDLAPLAVRLIDAASGGTGALVDANYPPTGRFFHASATFGDADIYIDDPLGAPIVAGHTFGDVTADIPITSGDLPLTYTDAGNIGSILFDEDRTILAGTRTNFYLVTSSTGTNAVFQGFLDRRPVETFARFSILNTSANFGVVDVYLLEPGETVDGSFPIIPGLALGGEPATLPLNADSFEMYITPQNEETILAGPIQLDTAVGEIYDALIYDNVVDPAIVDFVFIPQL